MNDFLSDAWTVVAGYFAEDRRRFFAIPVMAAIVFVFLHITYIGISGFCFVTMTPKDPTTHVDAFRAYTWTANSVPLYGDLMTHAAPVWSVAGFFPAIGFAAVSVFHIGKILKYCLEIAT